MLKRGYVGTYHHMSVKHLDRYVNEFAGRHNDRPSDTANTNAEHCAGYEREAAAVSGLDKLTSCETQPVLIHSGCIT